MNPSLPARRGGLAPRALQVGAAAALTMTFLFGSSGALAAPPPANTVIGNQASATYLDPNGASQLATSNLVQTTVLQVGSFNLDTKTTVTTDVVNTKTGAAGATVYAPHVLTNTGNGPDTFTFTVTAPASPNGFSKVEVFSDANSDGLPDSTAALCTVVPGAVCNVPAQTVAGNNGTFPFVVAYSIPNTATAATFTSPVSATVKATAGTPALYAAGNLTAADVDNVNLTNLAAFNATKSLSVPAVAWSGNSGTWPAASVSGSRSAPSCVATVGGASAPAAGCHYTTYTLRFNNTGGAAGRFVMTDTLPSGFTYVPGSAVWSSAPGTALADGAAGDPVGIDFGASGNVLTFVVDSLPVNASQTLSFVVMVDSDAVVGTSTTTNTAKYNPLAAPSGTTSTAPGTTGSSTNPASYTVVGTFGIVLGSADASASPTASLDSSAGVPNANAADNTTVASAGAGTTVKFPQTVFNIGNATDTVNLAATLGSFPAGTTFRFFAADGLTPLIDNNSDGIADTGPIAAGDNVKIVVAATLPAPAVIPSGPFNAIVTGTSTGDATKSETTRDTLNSMFGVLVDLTNTPSGNGVAGNTGNGDVGTGPSPQPTTPQTTSAGTGTLFNLFVKNNDSAENTYSLAASQTSSFPGSLPVGWTVKFVAAGGSCSSAAITTVKVSGNGGQTAVNACVTPPASQTPVSNQLMYFQVRSTTATSTGATAIDTKTDAVTVTTANTFGATLTPSNNGQVAPGGSVVYAHTLTNTGAQICEGPYTFAATLPSQDVNAGWTTALYIDVDGDGQIGSSDTLVTGSIPGPLPAGGTQKLLVKVFAPGGASAGATDSATVTVTFPAGATSCGAPSATDVSTVITGQMRLVKTQALDADCKGDDVPNSSVVLTAKPGECIVYRVVATNEGAAPVTNMSINDAVPAYTSLTGATQPGNQCVSNGVSGTALAFSSTASTVACGSTANTVAPGGTATLTFSVKVNN
jgi:trimeric autotransporter adhesin